MKLPVPKLTFTPPPYSLQGLYHATKTLRDMFKRIGTKDKDIIDPNEGDKNAFDGAGHVMGTCRMGKNPKTSVVDAQCRAHDHRNLFIVGASVFPTVGSPNPTLTLAALALRAAEDIGKQLGHKKPRQSKS
jgi:choline dehydrogenase-like flavoprotein